MADRNLVDDVKLLGLIGLTIIFIVIFSFIQGSSKRERDKNVGSSLELIQNTTYGSSIRDSLKSHFILEDNYGAQVGFNNGTVTNNFGLNDDTEENCLQALYPTGISYEYQKNQNPVNAPGTCLWALNHPEYQNWRENTTGLLWISADPGCGKSVLSRCIIDENLKDFKNKRKSTSMTVYYFFKDTSEDQRSATRAIASMLHQLFDEERSLIRYAVEKFRSQGKRFVNSLTTLWSILIEVVTSKEFLEQDFELICLLDALDECREDESQELVRLVGEFRQTHKSSKTKFLITSRPYLYLRAWFLPLISTGISIELDGNAEKNAIKEEINLVIEHRVKSFVTVIPSNTIEYLKTRLLGMEQRTYLWLRLLWEILPKKWPDTVREIEDIINNLPTGIIQSYERLLSLCQDPDFVRRVFQMVLVARRPLTVQEIDVALHIQENTTSMGQVELTGTSRLIETLPGKCGHMITIIDSRVYFIHQTVKEFLVQKGGSYSSKSKWQQSFDLVSSHCLLGNACLWQLLVPGFDNPYHLCDALLPTNIRRLEDDISKKKIDQFIQWPFMLYASISWADHYTAGNIQETLQELLDIEDDVSGHEFNRLGKSLHGAAAGGHLSIVHYLLDKGANVNAEGGDYGTALQRAASSGHQAIVQLLLDKGADVNAEGKYGTALQGAAITGHQAIVQLLLDKGADVNAEGKYGTALQEVARTGHQAIVQLLLDKGADVNAEGRYGTALQIAAINGHQAVVQLLLDKGADVNAERRNGTALQRAAQNGHPAIVQLLLDKGADVNAEGRYGTALQIAAINGHQAVVQLLLDKGADVNAERRNGTALQRAAQNGHPAIVRLLLDKGADVNAEGKYGTALQGATRNGHLVIVQLLLDNGANYGNALQTAAREGHQTVVQLLLDKGADVNAERRNGTALQIAARNGHQAVVQLLLDKGADVNAEGRHGTALQRAAQNGHPAIVQLLLDKGADVNAEGRYGTALQGAARNGYLVIVQLLLDNGANYGNALQTAAREGHQTVVQLLLDKGADVNAEGERYAGTALQEAASNGHREVFQLLIAHGASR